MMDGGIDWNSLLRWLLIISGISFVLAVILGVWVWHRVKRLRLPPDATFTEAMRLTPFSVVLLLDLLDLAFDFLAAPISWVLLGRLGLTKLRGATVLEAVIPGTQAIPMMSMAWLVVRLFGPQLDDIPWLRDRLNHEAQQRTRL